MKNIRSLLLAFLFTLAGCAKQAQAVPTTSPPTTPTATIILPTETPAEVATVAPIVSVAPDPTLDPIIFGAIGINEIQAYALETVANAIFTKTMDLLVASGSIQEYQIVRVTIFPGSGGLLSEITYNVRTTNPVWLEDGGTPAADNWINDKCNRFDFFTTETEYQLKNRRTCN